MKTLTPLGARSTGYLRLPALGRGRPPSHHGTCLPRALPTETLPERDSRQDPIERPNPNPNTPPTSKDAADGGSPLKRCGHLTAALTELAAAPEMAIDQGFYVGLDGIEPSTSALSVLLSSQTATPLRCGYVTASGLCAVSCLSRASREKGLPGISLARPSACVCRNAADNSKSHHPTGVKLSGPIANLRTATRDPSWGNDQLDEAIVTSAAAARPARFWSAAEVRTGL